MLSEFNVRTEVSRVETMDANPIRKARLLLRIAKNVKSAARRLALLSQHYYRNEDPLCGARFREAANRLCGVHEDVRLRAAHVLKPEGSQRNLDYVLAENSYPGWARNQEAVSGGAR